MDWFIRYRKDGLDRIARYGSLDAAIESTCRLMDEGYVVERIGYKNGDDAVTELEIDAIYSIWRRAQGPFQARA